MRYLKSIFLIVFVTGCHNIQLENVENNSDLQEINVFSEEVVNYDFIESAKYIFLDQEFLIGRISRIFFFKNNIFIQDDLMDRVVAYSMEGKYLFHIDQKGKGPNEYLKLSDFTIDKSNNNLILFDEVSHKIMTYSIKKQEFIKEQKINFYPTAFAWHDNRLFFFNPYTFNYRDSDKYHYSLITTTNDLKEERKYFKIDEKIGNFSSNPNRKGFFYGKNLYLLNRFDNVFYSLSSDSVSASFEIIFDKNEGFQDALNEAIAKGTRNIPIYQRYATDIQNFCETKEFISFNYKRNNEFFWVLFSKEKNSMIMHQARFSVTSESLQKNNIPIFFFPSFVHDDFFVSILTCDLMSKITKDGKFRKSIQNNMTNTNLLHRLMNYDLNGNPVIVLYKFK